MTTIDPTPIGEAILRELTASGAVRSFDAIKDGERWRLEAALRGGARRVLTTWRGEPRMWGRLDVLTAYVQREYKLTELNVRMPEPSLGRSMSAVS